METALIKIIETPAEFEAAQQRVFECMEQEIISGSELENELKVLTLLIKDYQARTLAFEEIDPIDYIQIRMEELGLEPKDLVKFIGDRSTVTKILTKKRELTVRMMREFHRHLNIPASALLA